MLEINDFMELEYELYSTYYPLFEDLIMQAFAKRVEEIEAKYGVYLSCEPIEFTIFIPIHNDRLTNEENDTK